jgi:hypothetical protein
MPVVLSALILSGCHSRVPIAVPSSTPPPLFDRNLDGMVDYFAFLVGALAVKPQGFQGDLPKRGGRISGDQINLYNQHARLVFVNVADDDFDGKVDGLIFGVRQQGEIWIDQWVAARSTQGSGQLDQALGSAAGRSD